MENFTEIDEDLQMTFTSEALADMSNEELIDIISIVSENGVRIYLDDVLQITQYFIELQNGTELEIENPSRASSLQSQFARYKMLKIQHSSNDTFKTLIEISQKLEDKFNSKIEVLSSTIEEVLNSVTRQNIDMIAKLENANTKSMSLMEHRIADGFEKPLALLTSQVSDLKRKHERTLDSIQNTLTSIDPSNLEKSTARLDKITKMLSDVIE